MILAIDIGNSNIVVGGIDEAHHYFIERIATDRFRTELEYAILIKNVLDIHGKTPDSFEGSIISSVVPVLTETLRIAVEKILHRTPLILTLKLRTDLNVLIENPMEMGADRIADAVAVIEGYSVPAVVIDMGTATTISVIDANRNFIGGIIYPGVFISLEALTSRAAKLAGISIEAPENLIGRNTVDCMKSGIIYGTASLIDGVIGRIAEELGCPVNVVATGGMSKRVIPYCNSDITLDENLLLKGMLAIYRKNCN